jgi:hypothetical protein
MQDYTHRFTEEYELFGFLVETYPPGAYNVNDYRSMANHQRGVALLAVGDMDAGATVDLQLYQATDIHGANAKVIPDKAITRLTQAGGDEHSAVIIEMRTEEMDVDGGFSFIGGTLTVAGGSATCALIGFGACSNQLPIPTTNWTEIVD